MALIIDAPMPKGKCWWEENGVEHECHLFPCWGNDDNCPIIGEIPDKHGDLKDTADIMQRYEHEIVKLKAELSKEQYEQIFHVFHVFIKPWIDQAPTILEATE